jgi:protein-tyrosine-phosphatase
MNRPARILVTDGDTLAALACVRDLGRAGYVVFACGVEVSPPAAVSRYVKSYRAIVSSWLNPQQAMAEIISFALSVGADAILPVSESTIAAVMRWRSELPTSIQILCAGEGVIFYGLSKIESFQRAGKLGLRVADGVVIGQSDPVPTRSFSEGAQIVRTDNHWDCERYCKGRNWVVRSQEELHVLHEELQGSGLSYLLQKYAAGSGCGAFFLMADGDVRLWHTHERLAEIPWSGGVSARKRLAFDHEIRRSAEHFFAGLNHTGIAMIEFRRTSPLEEDVQGAGDILFVELNARPWGSLALASHAGFAFVSQWAKLAGLQPSSSPLRSYAHNVAHPSQSAGLVDFNAVFAKHLYCTNIYPGEVQHLSSVIRSLVNGELTFQRAARFLIATWTTLIHPAMRFDFFASDDVRPCLRQWMRFAEVTAVALWSRVVVRASECATSLLTLIRGTSGLRELQIVHPRKAQLLFVCLGNRCRSPFAEMYLRDKLRGSKFSTLSRGLQVEDKRVPKRFHSLFRHHGFAPEDHQAQQLSEHDLDNADIVVLMEKSHLLRVLRTFGLKHLKKCVLVEEFTQSLSSEDIRDPFLLPPGAAVREFEQLRLCCDAFLEWMRPFRISQSVHPVAAHLQPDQIDSEPREIPSFRE